MTWKEKELWKRSWHQLNGSVLWYVVNTQKDQNLSCILMPLNKAAIRPKYEMPTLDELLSKLNKAIVFSTLDTKDGFY